MVAGTFWLKCQLSQLLPVCKKFQVELGAANGLVSCMGRFGIVCKGDPRHLNFSTWRTMYGKPSCIKLAKLERTCDC